MIKKYEELSHDKSNKVEEQALNPYYTIIKSKIWFRNKYKMFKNMLLKIFKEKSICIFLKINFKQIDNKIRAK